MADSDRPTAEMPVIPSVHVCKPDGEGYCGTVLLICGSCGHHGMQTTRYSIDEDEQLDTVQCPRCGHTAEIPWGTPPGTTV